MVHFLGSRVFLLERTIDVATVLLELLELDAVGYVIAVVIFESVVCCWLDCPTLGVGMGVLGRLLLVEVVVVSQSGFRTVEIGMRFSKFCFLLLNFFYKCQSLLSSFSFLQ